MTWQRWLGCEMIPVGWSALRNIPGQTVVSGPSRLVSMFVSLLRPAFFVRPDLEDTAQLPPWHVAANELGDRVPGNRWQSVGYARSGGRATEVTLQHFVILHLRPPGFPRQVPPRPGALGSPFGKKAKVNKSSQ